MHVCMPGPIDPAARSAARSFVSPRARTGARSPRCARPRRPARRPCQNSMHGREAYVSLPSACRVSERCPIRRTPGPPVPVREGRRRAEVNRSAPSPENDPHTKGSKVPEHDWNGSTPPWTMAARNALFFVILRDRPCGQLSSQSPVRSTLSVGIRVLNSGSCTCHCRSFPPVQSLQTPPSSLLSTPS